MILVSKSHIISRKIINKLVIYLPILLMGIVFIFMMSKVGISTGSDDTFYTKVCSSAEKSCLFNYFYNIYLSWSGRIPTYFATISFLGFNLQYWRIANTLIFMILVYSIIKLALGNTDKLTSHKKIFLILLICLSIFGIYTSTFSSSVQWISGSFNYLWPVSLGLFTLIPFKNAILNKKTGKTIFILSFITAFYASYSEQMVIVMIFFAFVSIFLNKTIRKKPVDKKLIALCAWIIVNACILFIAPGNNVRYYSEIGTWYPGFDHLSFLFKILQGNSYLLNHFVVHITALLYTISCLSALLAEGKLNKLISKIIILIPILLITAVYTSLIPNGILLPSMGLAIHYRISISQSISTILAIAPLFICLFYSLYIASRTSLNRILILSLYICAFLSSMIISLSPTIFGSGTRIFFLSEILFVVILAYLITETFRRKISLKTAFLASIPVTFYISTCISNIVNDLNHFTLRYF